MKPPLQPLFLASGSPSELITVSWDWERLALHLLHMILLQMLVHSSIVYPSGANQTRWLVAWHQRSGSSREGRGPIGEDLGGHGVSVRSR